MMETSSTTLMVELDEEDEDEEEEEGGRTRKKTFIPVDPMLSTLSIAAAAATAAACCAAQVSKTSDNFLMGIICPGKSSPLGNSAMTLAMSSDSPFSSNEFSSTSCDEDDELLVVELRVELRRDICTG